MILDQIEVFGYKRLRRAKVYVGRKSVALVGPNEAGKSTLLSALRLFDNENPVPESAYTRALRGTHRRSDADVVRLWYPLTNDQQNSVAKMPLEVRPRHYRRHKHVDGKIVWSLFPEPKVSAKITYGLKAALPVLNREFEQTVGKEVDEVTDEELLTRAALENVSKALGDGSELSGEDWERAYRWISSIEIDVNASLSRAVQQAELFQTWARPQLDLQETIRDSFDFSTPSFVMFTPADRALQFEYALDDPTTEGSPALANLLQVAEVTLGEFSRNRNDPGIVADLKDEAQRRLSSFFASKWSQEPVSVRIELEGGILRILVRDEGAHPGGWISVSERSDGLRMFVSLAAFLAQKSPETPPILLIDEAEQHLHLNAQADLVQMLSGLTQVQQVIYTTHSPGCLPSDIGNGVRFVEPLDDGTSIIRHDFWDLDNNSHVGFNPLLLVMGAGAAAFSALRYAVFAEGAADMLLLPTLIRLATNQADLPYQIAPGISVANTDDLRRMDFSAGRTCFFVDGDAQGTLWKSQLVEADVPGNRIRQLPKNVALEDLLDRNYYLKSVADLEGIPMTALADVGQEENVKHELDLWAIRHNHTLCSDVALIELMLGKHESEERRIKLAGSKIATLRALDGWVRRNFDLPTEETPPGH